VDNYDEQFRGMTVLTNVSRAETRIEAGQPITRTVSRTLRVRSWCILLVGVTGGETVRTILSVIAGYI